MQSEVTRVEMTCPINGKVCKNGVRSDFEDKEKQCRWWTHVAGKDPQSEKVIDHFDCAMAWVPVVVLESSQMTRMGTATMQDFRNETHENIGKFNAGIARAAVALEHVAAEQKKLLDIVPLPDVIDVNNGGGPR